MPPRIHVPTSLNGVSFCFRPSLRPLIHSANVTTFAERKAQKDPYALAQSARTKTVNLARQKILQDERKIALGDPVRGLTTPFVKSFDSVSGSSDVIFDSHSASGTPQEQPLDSDLLSDPTSVGLVPQSESEGGIQNALVVRAENEVLLNHYLRPGELEESLAHSYGLTEPETKNAQAYRDPKIEADDKRAHDEGHTRAVTALARIVSLANSNQADKTRANIQRCISTFGRHNTDSTLRPRAPAISQANHRPIEKTPRAGPDTGSSEVQVAILTAKIRVLANRLEMKKGQKDKINKRNLRVMVHKRQKLLTYLRRKERGSDRWVNLVETLGLTEGTWQGEISL